MEYKYYKEVTGELVRVHIEQDTTPENPRYDWDGNIGHMMCWHRNYQLGDYKENSYSDNLDFLNNLLRARVSESTILNFVKNHRAANFLTLDYDRHRKVWVLGQELRHEIPNFRVIEENEKKEWLVDAVIDALLQADKWRLLERHAGIVYLPLFLYDHSGITMNVDGFNDPWDSGQVGYIYTDKKTIMQNVGGYYVGNNVDGRFVKTTERNWKKVAYHDMESEVSIYDQYLTGQVYGIITEEFAEGIAKLPKMCPHFHLSLQSGCDATLKRMNRRYTSSEYAEKCELLRKYFPNPALTTDVIVGFPGETEEEFKESYDFVDSIDFYETHIFKYSRREGTKAAVMPDQVDEQIKAKRSAQLIELGEKKRAAYEQSFQGKEVEVLVEENLELNGKEVQTGHTKEYMKIALETNENLKNSIVKVQIGKDSQIIH